MRIIAGKYKNKKIISSLKGIKVEIKPTTSKVKEAVFNIINNHFAKNCINIEQSSFLDLCCGSGAVGIEAISRGFKQIYFIDKNNESLEITRRNLQNLESNNENLVVIKSNFNDLQIECETVFDVIYLDPPYNMLISQEVLVGVAKYLHLNSLLIIETSRELHPSLLIGYDVISIKQYGKSFIFIMKLKG